MSNPPESSKTNKPLQAIGTTDRYDLSSKSSSPSLRVLKLIVMLLLSAVVVFAVYYFFMGGKESLSTAEAVPTLSTGPSGASAASSAAPAGGGSGRSSSAMMGGDTKVSVVAVEARAMDFIIPGLGTALPSENVLVRSQVSGPLTKIFFEEGALVESGDPLFEIDPRPFAARLQQARAQFQQNEAQLANAEADFKRYQTLFNQNSIARQQVDTQEALVKQQVANRASLQAQIVQAEIEFEYTTITAPISGRVGLRQVDIGNLVQANDSAGLVTITQSQPMNVEFAISEIYVTQIASTFYQQMPIEVRLYDRNSSQYLGSGHLSSIDNQIDIATGTVKIKAHFDNNDNILFPNQFVNARLVVERVDQALSVLTDAIQHGRQGAFVFLVNDDMTVEQRDIQLGIVDGDYSQVSDGLVEGDRVVVEGVDRLRVGSKVEIVD